jgi:signal transduction histidine kinase
MSPLTGAARRSIRAKLLRSYLLVVAVGALTFHLVAFLGTPALLDWALRHRARSPGVFGLDELPTAARDDVLAAFEGAMIPAVAIATAAATIAAVLTAVVVSRRITAPIRALAAASARLAEGHYRERVAVPDDDEIGALAGDFNRLAAALDRTEQQRLRLVGDVAHELRTPLATIEGYMEGLLDDVVAPSPELWAQLHGEAGRLRRLVDDLQELSRAEAGQIPLRPVALDPGDLLERAAARMRPQFDVAGIALSVAPVAALPAVLADPDRTLQVLVNLLGNALRHTPAGGTVALAAAPREGQVALTVADTGGGIAPEHLPHLFDRFYRADRSRSRALGGSGIGLTIARALVEAQGGAIDIASAGVGLGTTVTVTLPQASRRS